MRLLKPSWVSHEGNPIFSLDIHPDGSRLATGGQGDDSGRIVIWNMAPIANEEDEKDENVPKMLCQLDNHLACVNCVRWSNNGKFLASGGDDKVIMIWQTGRYSGGTAVFGAGGKVNVEQWRCASTLRGHAGDILDLAWSPHDAWLASCSVDNTVVVWNALKFPEMLSILRGHSGLVKGVSWDPVGKYLASQSDDKSLLVWRTLDWQQETTITEPFDECGGTTHVLRLSWSPDGQYLVSAHAMNNSGPTAQIIERHGWKTEKDFVGHRKAVTVAKFNPNILAKANKESSKVQHYCCCALGSRDRSLSIWLTTLKRPLVVIHDLFANSVLDVSWSRRGHQLTVCSGDGTVAFIDFSEEEIGRPLSQDELSVMHQKMYGKSLVMIRSGEAATTVIENPAMLKLKQQQQVGNGESDANTRSQESLKMHFAAKGPINKQIETRTADGRRRITPMFISPAPDLGEAPLPFNSKSQPTFSSSTESKSKIIIEKRDEIVVVPNSHSNGIQSNSNSASSANEPTCIASAQLPVVAQVSSTVTTVVPTTATAVVTTTVASASTPTATGSVNAAASVITSTTTSTVMSVTSSKNTNATSTALTCTTTTTATSTTTTTITTTTTAAVATVLPVAALPVTSAAVVSTTSSSPTLPTEPAKSVAVEKIDKVLDKPKEAKQTKVVETPVSLKRKEIDEASRPAKRRPGRPPLSEKLVTTTVVAPKHCMPPAEKEQPKEMAIPLPASLRLPPLKADKHISLKVPLSRLEPPMLLELDNNIHASTTLTVAKLKCAASATSSWEVLLFSKAVAIAGSSLFVAVVCEDHSLSVFSSSGQRLFPSIILPSAVSRLLCNEHYVMVLTTKANVYVWDIRNRKNVIRHESLSPIMTNDSSIINSSLTDDGCPVVSLSTGRAFVFSHCMGSWMLIANADDAIQQCSDYSSCMPAQTFFNGSVLPLAALQAQGKRPSQQAGRLFRNAPSLQQAGTLSYLDSQLVAAHTLHSAKEYKFWLLTLARYSTQEGLEIRIRQICNDLLGPLHASKTSTKWDPYILGFHKHDLLQEILPIVGSNLRLQRLFTEYQEQLEMKKKS